MATRYNLGGLPILGKSVQMGDVYVGAAVSLFGNALVNYVNVKTVSATMPAGVLDKLPVWLRPIVGPSVAGAVLYFAQKKSKPSRAEGHAAGAIAVGIAQVIKTLAIDQVNKAPADSALKNLNFAGVPVYGVTPQFQASSGPSYPGLNGFGEVVSGRGFLPGPRNQHGFGEVVQGPAYRGGMADQAVLNGLAGVSQATMSAEAETV
jgi:hypothetical protein